MRFTPNFAIHVIELPKFRLKADEIQTSLERWCYFLRHAAKLDPAAMPETLQGPLFQQAVETLRIMNQTQQEREAYETRLKAQLDLNTYAYEAEQRGLKRGLTKGRKQGRQKGMDLGLTKGMDLGLTKGRKEGLIEGERNAIAFALDVRVGVAIRSVRPGLDALRPKCRRPRQASATASTSARCSHP